MPATAPLTRPPMVGFVSRLSAAALSQDAGAAESWIQVAVAGAFSDPGRYGDFEITPEHLANMAAVFASGKFPVPPTELCVDYDHLTLSDGKGAGDGKAAGWIRALDVRADGTELWAKVEWTEAGADAIRDREYRFFSPVIVWNKTSHVGEVLGPVLFNGALTNTPFLQGMQPLALSASHARGRSPLLVLATITDNDKKTRLDEAIRQRFASLDDRYSCWLVDTENGDVAIFYDRGRYYRIGYAIGADGSVSLLGDPVEAVISYPALSATGGRPLMSKTLITLTAATGGAVQIDPEQLEATDLVKALRAKLPAEGSVVVLAADFAALQANVTDLTGKVTALSASLATEQTKREAAEKTLSLAASTSDVDALIRAHKATPAEREGLIELHQTSPALFAKLTASRQPIAELGAPKGSDSTSADATAELETAVQAQLSANPKFTRQQAMAAALDANPKLYRG